MFSVPIEISDSIEVEIVGNCPNTLDWWRAAAIWKNCSTNVYGNESIYHCLQTEEKQLVEVCVRPMYLTGVCPYFDTVGGVVQRSNISCVSADSAKNCTLYSSENVYDYPVCYPTQEIPYASFSGATRIHDDATRCWIYFMIKCILIFKIL